MQSAEVTKLLFSPNGAINRKPFVLGVIGIDAVVIISLLFLIFTPVFVLHLFGLDQALHHVTAHASTKVTITLLVFSLIFTTLYVALYGALLWAHLCLMLKRLRDLNLSVWYVIYPYTCTAIAGSIHVSQILNSGLNPYWMLTKTVAVIGGTVFIGILALWPSRINNI